MYSYNGTVDTDVKGDNFFTLHNMAMDILRKHHNYADLCTDKVPATTEAENSLRELFDATPEAREITVVREYLNDLRHRGMLINRSVVEAAAYLSR